MRFPQEGAITNGSADLVLMQPQLDNCTLRPPTDANGYWPNGLAFDSFGNLYVSEYFNNRVLMYQGAAFSTTNGMSASFVWGQPDFNSNNSGNGLNQLHQPARVHYDSAGNILWVAGNVTFHGLSHSHDLTDTQNKRVLGFASYFSGPSQNLGVQISFQGKSPAVIVFPKGKSGYRLHRCPVILPSPTLTAILQTKTVRSIHKGFRCCCNPPASRKETIRACWSPRSRFPL